MCVSFLILSIFPVLNMPLCLGSVNLGKQQHVNCFFGFAFNILFIRAQNKRLYNFVVSLDRVYFWLYVTLTTCASCRVSLIWGRLSLMATQGCFNTSPAAKRLWGSICNILFTKSCTTIQTR